MSGKQDEDELPPYEETEQANPTINTAAANASQNENYKDQKSAISTTQQVSATSDNTRASRMCEFTCLSTARQLLTGPSSDSAPIRIIAAK